MGLRHPNPAVAETSMSGQTLALAEASGLLGRTVHANRSWVPYGERQNHYLDADLGVSMHDDHLETRFSFRTRTLDYLWAGLPMVLTQGDAIADLTRTRGLGRVVPARDERAIADAVLDLLGDASAYGAARRAVQETASPARSTLPSPALVGQHLTTRIRSRIAMRRQRQIAGGAT
jgi:glycosyltransferase involved in cell wall biosynthesis